MTASDPDDPRSAPIPNAGWSGRIVSVPEALIVTTVSQEMIQPMGVFDATGAYVHQAVLWRGQPLMTEPALVPAQDHLPGRWIWGGVLLNHFGHFLTESTGRLWALDAVAGPLDGIVFVSKRDADDADTAVELQAYHRIFFDLAGVNVPIRVVTRPTRVDLLEVPGQGFGIGKLASGTAAFRGFMARRFAHDVAPKGGPKLYVSRSGLSAVRGGILEEDRLERLLVDEGYEVYHPQKHALTDQIARYKAAEQVVALDGSALHLVAMAGRQGQQVAVIKRRDSQASDSIVAHLAAFLATQPQVIDVIQQDWVRSDRRRADRFSIGQLDFAALGLALAQAGFITDPSNWHALTDEQAQAAIRGFESQLKRGKLTFAPLARGTKRRPVDPAVAAAARPAKPRRDQRQAAKAAGQDGAVSARKRDRLARRAAATVDPETQS